MASIDVSVLIFCS